MTEEIFNNNRNVYSAIDIANWFLNYNYQLRELEDEDTDNISNLKLQKLLYYAQGCYLALRDKALFNDKILAWKHGPVVESVYYTFRKFGADGISEFDKNIEIDKDTESILIEVYNVFGKYSAWGLREMTHNETPWKSTEQSEEISQESIKEYFEENYVS
ncbi:MAG: DUF4065 domain-containing protein [Peptoniphilus harei]|nr:DUF4065 domain-containing protein [Peptoniphilus harei]MDU1663747.1 DUF4065 domain-containing protein [Peptoniphilus harei]